MNLVTFFEPVTVTFRKSTGGATMTFDANRNYVMPNNQLDRASADPAVMARMFRVSRLDMRIPNFDVRSARKIGTQRLLFYNGSGGYGDQIMSWPVVKILADHGFEVHVLSDPGNQMCWWNFPWVKSLHILPVQYEFFKLFDHYVVYDNLTNQDETPDQLHPVDALLEKIGFDHRTFSNEQKCVAPVYTQGEFAAVAQFRGRSFAIYQMAAANPIRSLPPSDSAFLLSKLAQEYPYITWLALVDGFSAAIHPHYKGYTDSITEEQKNDKGEAVQVSRWPNVIPYFSPNLRELWALAQSARVVVSPDSLMIHVAGCQGVPCVGLWGLTDPARRAKYYTNHIPIHHKEVCAHSPCFHYLGTFPKYCPPRKDRKVCEVMAAISPDEVIRAVDPFLRPHAPVVKAPPDHPFQLPEAGQAEVVKE